MVALLVPLGYGVGFLLRFLVTIISVKKVETNLKKEKLKYCLVQHAKSSLPKLKYTNSLTASPKFSVTGRVEVINKWEKSFSKVTQKILSTQ